MSSLEDFSRRITTMGSTIAENADKLVRTVALAVDQAVVSGTPVDTGRARSNWITQVGSRAEGTIGPYAPGKLGTTGAANTTAATAQAQLAIAAYQGGAGQEIHITNNLPYIAVLNSGTSAQAPAGFVEDAVQEAVQKVQAARLTGA